MCGDWLVGRSLVDESPTTASPPAVFVEATAWVATAVASGVLGNAAYDALKAAYAKITRRTPPLREQTDRDVLLAQLAVAARCGELGMPVPEYSSLRCTSASASASENRVFLESTTLKATVVISRSVDGGSGISVTLYTVGE